MDEFSVTVSFFTVPTESLSPYFTKSANTVGSLKSVIFTLLMAVGPVVGGGTKNRVLSSVASIVFFVFFASTVTLNEMVLTAAIFSHGRDNEILNAA